jgi:inhibitor of KinA sporulation pathway (predicted exonuclease)
MSPVLVVDLESTCWPGEFHLETMDIIEIGAVLVEDGWVAGEFQS